MSGGPAPKGPSPLARALLRLYPAGFRRRNGEDWLRFLAHQRSDDRYRGALGGVLFWTEVTVDALLSAGGARWEVGMGRIGEAFANVTGEVRIAVRSLLGERGFSLLVVTTLALGIGATTAIFSLANWVLLRPPPGVTEPERTVTVRFPGRDGSWFLASHPDYLWYAANTAALEALAGVYDAQAHVVLPGSDLTRRLPAQLVTDGYASALGLVPSMGRVPEPATARSPREVMVSHHLWVEAFDRDDSTVGRTLTVNGEPFVVVGVGPEGFRGAGYPMEYADLWFPVTAHPDLVPNYPDDALSQRGSPIYFALVGRLAEGAAIELARAQLDAGHAGLLGEHGETASTRHLEPRYSQASGSTPAARTASRARSGSCWPWSARSSSWRAPTQATSSSVAEFKGGRSSRSASHSERAGCA